MLTSKTFRTVAGGGYGLKLYLHPTAGRDHVSERRPDLAGIRRMDDLHPGKHSLHRSAEATDVSTSALLSAGETGTGASGAVWASSHWSNIVFRITVHSAGIVLRLGK